jgi:E3 ubiquitin-protein ligase HERC4
MLRMKEIKKEKEWNKMLFFIYREQYVQLYIDFIFNKSVKQQYKAFENGFQKVCGGRILQLFHSRELMLLLIGNENYDWEEFEKNAIYKHVYSKEDPTIILFWQVFHELPLEEKKKFLVFLTGTDRIPIQGMKIMRVNMKKILKFIIILTIITDSILIPKAYKKLLLR